MFKYFTAQACLHYAGFSIEYVFYIYKSHTHSLLKNVSQSNNYKSYIYIYPLIVNRELYYLILLLSNIIFNSRTFEIFPFSKNITTLKCYLRFTHITYETFKMQFNPHNDTLSPYSSISADVPVSLDDSSGRHPIPAYLVT